MALAGSSCFSSMNGVYTSRLMCLNNGTYCGDWTDKVFKPVGCEFREVTAEQAQKCLKNKTIACIGDSQMFDFCAGFGMFMYGFDENDPDTTDYINNREYYMSHFLKNKRDKHDQLIFSLPEPSIRDYNDFDWQVIMYSTNAANEEDRILQMAHEIMNNEYQQHIITEGTNDVLRKHDFVLYQYGLHFKQFFNTTPYGEKFFDHFVQPWIDSRTSNSVPSVWTAMNGECRPLIDPRWRDSNQPDIVEEANYYVRKELARRNLPYFDTNIMLQSSQRCDISRDGLHVKMWSEIIRSRMLLNYLCDDDWNWVGDPNAFVNLV